MKEYILCTTDYASKTRFTPAHFIYKIKDGRLLRGQIPLTLRGGLMVIGRIDGLLNVEELSDRIVSECNRFSFDGALVALSPIPDEGELRFANLLSDKFAKRGLTLYLPQTYSSCQDANLLVPGFVSHGTFEDYLSELLKKYGASHLSLELSCQAFEFAIPQEFSGSPISPDVLREILCESGAMTFYSSDLCSNYFTYDNRFFLFDTAETLLVKKNCAEKLGFDACFYFISPKNKSILQKLENVK